MHPAWESLMSAYDSDSSVLIASADCQTQSRQPGTGDSLCKKENTKYIPHLMYGPPDSLQEYNGGRDLATLKAFVESHKSGSNVAPPVDAHQKSCPMKDSHVVV
jgi:hypothetical protein